MAVFYDVGLFVICMMLQTILLYFCLELLFDRFLYRMMIKILLYAFFFLLRLGTVFWVTSPIVSWLLSFSAILFLTFYYRSNRIKKYLIAAVFSSFLIFSEAFIPLIGGNILLQFTLVVMYLLQQKQFSSPTPIKNLDLFRNDTHNMGHFASDLPETAESLVRLRHDLKHHIVTLKTLAEQEDCAAIVQYLHTMESNISAAETYISTNNAGIDNLLNALITKAASCHCFMNTDVLLPEHVNLPFSSINTILGNIIDNAIEAAALSEEKKVSVSIYMQKGVLYIDVSNTYGNTLTWQSGRLMSNKKPGKWHGIGLRSVETMVKKLNGILEYQHDEKLFRILIMIYIE
jgi:signal transduction histidine kinase